MPQINKKTMTTNEKIINKFSELEIKMRSIKVDREFYEVDRQDWQVWSNDVINLFNICFGGKSNFYINFQKLYNNFPYEESSLNSARGIFISAKDAYNNNFYESLEKQISGEIFGNFVTLAKSALAEQHKDVAAVLACAALEDALKKYASLNGLDIDDKSMAEVVNVLKSNSLVKGAQKTLFDAMPKIRNYAMHANWDKITLEDVSSIVGFVEGFLLNNF
jgi:hypothetical protein